MMALPALAGVSYFSYMFYVLLERPSEDQGGVEVEVAEAGGCGKVRV